VLLHANLVVLPYRNPFHVAKSAATVQQLSGGRLALALGAGYLRPEFDALGARFDDREAQVRSGVEAMRAAWTGEPLHLEGEGWQAAGNTLLPAAPPRVLLRGGNSRAAIEHAAQAFDAWSPFEVVPERAVKTRTTPLHASAGLAEGIASLREYAAAAGRPAPEVWLVRPTDAWLDRDDGEVRDELARLEELGVTWVAAALGPLGSATLDDLRRSLERLSAVAR
jgi:alkanesulfonate monooxygenase SsuD/methylene tetrahydromethanopterin reductase-like flavin-dependent oxidoreductase (luciferase family)